MQVKMLIEEEESFSVHGVQQIAIELQPKMKVTFLVWIENEIYVENPLPSLVPSLLFFMRLLSR
jgi:hypothetical protein